MKIYKKINHIIIILLVQALVIGSIAFAAPEIIDVPRRTQVNLAPSLGISNSGFQRAFTDKSGNNSQRLPLNNVKKVGAKVEKLRGKTEVLVKRIVEAVLRKLPDGYVAKFLYWQMLVARKLRDVHFKGFLEEISFKRISRWFNYQGELSRELAGEKIIWINGIDVGEWNIAESLVRDLQKKYPGHKLVLSSPYKMGVEYAKNKFPGVKVVYTSYGMPVLRPGFFKSINVELFIMIEGPGRSVPEWFKAIKQKGGKVIVVNGLAHSFIDRVSYRAYPDELFGNIDVLLVRDQAELQQIRNDGLPVSQVQVAGDIKFDTSSITVSESQQEQLRNLLGINNNTPVLLAGSTWPGEPEIIIRAYEKLKQKYPDLVLILAPRRMDTVEETMAAVPKRFRCLRKTELAADRSFSSPSPDIVVLDTVGELRQFYSICSVAIIGNSFGKQHGGHNPLEPANFAKPVVFGPNMEHFATMTSLMFKRNAAIQVADETELYAALERLFSDSRLRVEYGNAAHQVLQENRGAVERTMQVIDGLLNPEQVQDVAGVEGIRQRDKYDYDDISALYGKVYERRKLQGNMGWLINHIRRGAAIVENVADRMGLSKKDKAIVLNAFFMHDLGKLYSEDLWAIVSSNEIYPRKAPNGERIIINRHAEHSINILNELGIDVSDEVSQLIRYHHTPEKIEDSRLRQLAEIIFWADICDAFMADDRPYQQRELSKDFFNTFEKWRSELFSTGVCRHPEVYEALRGFVVTEGFAALYPGIFFEDFVLRKNPEILIGELILESI
ncbi:MAG: glycosyltransferase N-terminal domain-containing protein [Candidatus Omnitrophota bacterium]